MIKIVIVDDEELILRGMKRRIERFGEQYQVIEIFESSLKALAYLKENEIDLLITDIRMPEMNGLELIEKAIRYNPNVRGLILSGYSDFAYVKTALKFGAIDYLLKPVDEDELKDALSRVVSIAPKLSEQEKGCYVKTGLSRDVACIKHEIEVNCADFELNSISDKLGKSKDYLCKQFKSEMGVNLSDYLIAVRIQIAREMLQKDYSCKIYEVSEKVGYKDVSYFSKLFKRETGVSPKEYIKKYYTIR